MRELKATLGLLCYQPYPVFLKVDDQILASDYVVDAGLRLSASDQMQQ